MYNNRILNFLLLSAVVCSLETYGQVDLTTELLLQRSGNEPEQEQPVPSDESSRLRRQVREPLTPPPPTTKVAPAQRMPVKKQTLPYPYTQPAEKVEERPSEVISAKPTAPVIESEAKKAQPIEQKSPISTPQEPLAPHEPAAQPEINLERETSSFLSPLKLKIALMPFFFINESQSNYWSRSYTTNGTGYGLGISMEILEDWEVNFLSKSALTTAMQSEPNSAGVSGVNYFEQQFRIGYQAFTTGLKTVKMGLSSFSKGLSAPKQSAQRISISSEGLGVFFEHLQLAQSEGDDDVKILLQLFPQVLHKELKNPSSSVRSGKFADGHAVSFQWSKVNRIGKDSSLEYGAQYWFEKALFKGVVSAPDSLSGESPDGVEVTDQTALLFINLTWGQ